MVDGFFRKIKDAIDGSDNERANYENSGQYDDVRPASEDPYGDPADSEVADAGMYGNVRPASEDPYGDPADDPFA